jgi:hypothetical protein
MSIEGRIEHLIKHVSKMEMKIQQLEKRLVNLQSTGRGPSPVMQYRAWKHDLVKALLSVNSSREKGDLEAMSARTVELIKEYDQLIEEEKDA